MPITPAQHHEGRGQKEIHMGTLSQPQRRCHDTAAVLHKRPAMTLQQFCISDLPLEGHAGREE